MSGTFLRLREAGIGYGKTPLLSGVCAEFRQGDFACVVGRNGSGKSTLLRALAGIIPYTGSIALGGGAESRELRAVPHGERARRLSYLPQTRPVPAMDVRTLLAHGRFPHMGFSKTLSPADRAKIADAAALTGIGGLLDRSVASLSGGERQRAYIALAVAQDADLILLDEPATYLDVACQLETMELLRALHRSGKGIVMVSHDLPQAFTVGERIFAAANGALFPLGSPSEAARSGMIAETFGVCVEAAQGSREVYAFGLRRTSEFLEETRSLPVLRTGKAKHGHFTTPDTGTSRPLTRALHDP